VLETLAVLGQASAPQLVEHIYIDVPVALHAMAARSVTAHLLKLAADGLVAVVAGETAPGGGDGPGVEPLWRLVDSG